MACSVSADIKVCKTFMIFSGAAKDLADFIGAIPKTNEATVGALVKELLISGMIFLSTCISYLLSVHLGEKLWSHSIISNNIPLKIIYIIWNP